MEFGFLNEYGITVDYPKDLLEIPREVESALLNSNLRLTNYVVKRIAEYIEEHEYKIEDSIKEIS